MVHALEEASRVVRPGGIVIDLRPAPALRQVGIRRAGKWQYLGVMHECLDDDHAADRAVRSVIGTGLLVLRRQITVDCERVIDKYDEFASWAKEFIQPERMSRAQPVLRRVARAHAEAHGRAKIVVHGPLRLQVLDRKEIGTRAIRGEQ